jgi:hypothetical protein
MSDQRGAGGAGLRVTSEQIVTTSELEVTDD